MQRHPEMAEQQDHVLETLAHPELIQQGDDSELLAIHFYPQTPLTSKYLVVVYRKINREDGFILTTYLPADHQARWVTLWKR